jgi:RNA polymerase sigma-70 factor (ECF subfamily)
VTEPPDDVELLTRTSGGDREAFEAFMERHVAAVHRLLRSLQATPEETEDAVQECFIAAWRNAAAFRGPGSARGWLFATARNALRRQHRRRVQEPHVVESLEALGERAGWGASTDFDASYEARDTLEWAMKQLSDEERDVVSLRDIGGFSGDETADALGLTPAAMKSRLHRGRLRLMEVLRSVEAKDG